MSHLPLEPEKVYHLYTHANGSENLFRSDENYYYFVKELQDWLYSSWHAYLLDKPTLLARDTGLDWFGSRQHFLEIHEALKKRDVTQNLSGFDDITVS